MRALTCLFFVTVFVGSACNDPTEPCVGIETATVETCDDGDMCTIDGVGGDADACESMCVYEAITQCQSGDGCCPAGCDYATDADCEDTCGDGVVDPGEACDGGCPTSCGDNNACTVDTLSGAADTCDAVCRHALISQCQSGDGCCPADCSHVDDGDCVDTCGNGALDVGETCEGDCPTSCDDADACTEDTMTGSAANCNVECVSVAINVCQSGDGCCAAGCDALSDLDCQGTWVDDKVATGSGYLMSASIAFDASGQLHTVYWDDRLKELRHAQLDGEMWTSETIVSHPTVTYTDLASDSAGVLHMVAAGRYLTFSGGIWTERALFVGSGATAYSAKLLIDANDAVHVAFLQIADGAAEVTSIQFASYASGAWTRDAVETITGAYYLDELAAKLSAAGDPVVYYRALGDYRFARRVSAGQWQTEQVTSESPSRAVASLQVMADGAYALFGSYTDTGRRLVDGTPGAWNDGTIVSGSGILADAPIGDVRVAKIGYTSSADPRPLTVDTRVGRDWISQTVLPAVTNRTVTDAIVDPRGSTWVAVSGPGAIHVFHLEP